MTAWIPVALGLVQVIMALFKSLPESDARWRDTRRLKRAMREKAKAERRWRNAKTDEAARKAKADMQIWMMVIQRLTPAET